METNAELIPISACIIELQMINVECHVLEIGMQNVVQHSVNSFLI